MADGCETKGNIVKNKGFNNNPLRCLNIDLERKAQFIFDSIYIFKEFSEPSPMSNFYDDDKTK